jgi:hypothetical protein
MMLEFPRFYCTLTVLLALVVISNGVEAATARLNSFTVVRPPKPNIVQGGQSYSFQIRFENAGFAAPIITSSNVKVIPGFSLSGRHVAVLSKKLAVRSVSAPVRVRLTANWGGRTRTLNLTVSPPRPTTAPTQSAPNNNFYEYRDQTYLGWSRATGASEYRLCFKREGASGCPNNGTDGIAVRTANRNHRFSPRKFRGQKTIWYVRGCNPLGCSPYSGARRIFVRLPHATLKSPASPAYLRPGSVTFSWTPVYRAKAYSIVIDNKIYKASGGITDRYLVKISSDLAGRPIGWHVSACNSDTGCSIVGDQRTFYVRP